jgi:hypothetical protein
VVRSDNNPLHDILAMDGGAHLTTKIIHWIDLLLQTCLLPHLMLPGLSSLASGISYAAEGCTEHGVICDVECSYES